MRASDEQLTALLNYCIEFATEMLARCGEFHPFGAEIDEAGEMRAVGFFDGNEMPSGKDAYTFAHDALASRAKNGGVLACALAVNVNIPKQFKAEFDDGVRVQVEAESYSRLIYAPYALSQAGLLRRKQTVRLASMFAVEVAPSLFR